MSVLNMKVKFADNGLCRVYYNDDIKGLLCYQSSIGSSFELYECTQDGEPSHCIPFEKYLEVTEYPRGDSRVESDLRDWLFKKNVIRLNKLIAVYHRTYGMGCEDDMSLNDHTHSIIRHYLKRFVECYLIKVNRDKDERDNRKSISQKIVLGDGQRIYNFCACFVVPVHSEDFVDMIYKREAAPAHTYLHSMAYLTRISDYASDLGGESLTWV